MQAIELVPAGTPDPALVATLAADLREHTGLPVQPGDPLPIDEAWRTSGGGLRSMSVLHALMARVGRRSGRWHLAIAEAELCGGEVGRVFGEAAQDGCCAVVGIAPLRAGSGSVGEVVRARLLTAALHELGHLAGAEHCRRASCVMYPSRDIADTDRKGTAFCRDCGAVVQWPAKRKT